MCKTYFAFILLHFLVIFFSHTVCAKNVDDVENLCFQHPM